MRTILLALALVIATAGPADAAGTVGTTFPDGFDVPTDHSLNQPVIGFGAAGDVERVPVIFLHGNNDTPYPTDCNGSYGAIQKFAQFFADEGYNPSELWALGYQGDQCDLLTDQTRRAGEAHTTIANVPDLRAFVQAVLDFTGATQVDLVGHSLGGTLSREWMRQDDAYRKVRRLVSIDSPHHGIINCSPDPANYYHSIGFVPDSPVCLEYGAADTPLLTALNAGDETPGPTEYLAIVNTDASFVYIAERDGILPAVPAQDRHGNPHDFSQSARQQGAKTVELTGQGAHDMALQAAHTGIANSPDAWQATFDFLSPQPQSGTPGAPPPTTAPSPTGGRQTDSKATNPHPATGGGVHPMPMLIVISAVFVVLSRGRRAMTSA